MARSRARRSWATAVAGLALVRAAAACADPKGLADVDGTRPVATPTAGPSTTGAPSTRRGDTTPVPLGTPAPIGEGWTMTVVGYTADADAAVAAENPFNDAPPEGQRYVLVRVRLEYGAGASADRSTPSAVRLDAIGASATYRSSDAPVVAPDELNRATDVFRGGSVTGTVAFAVAVDDAADLVVAASAGDDRDERLFATTGAAAGTDASAAPTTAASAAPAPSTVASAVPSSTVTTAAPYGSRANPVPLGKPADIGDGWRLRVDGVTPQADDAVAAANQFNAPPPPGRHFVLVRVTLTYGVDGADEKANPLVLVRVVGPSNVAVSWSDTVVVAPDALNVTADVVRGSSITGNLAFAVTDDDAARLLLYASVGFGNDDVFFATGPTR